MGHGLFHVHGRRAELGVVDEAASICVNLSEDLVEGVVTDNLFYLGIASLKLFAVKLPVLVLVKTFERFGELLGLFLAHELSGHVLQGGLLEDLVGVEGLELSQHGFLLLRVHDHFLLTPDPLELQTLSSGRAFLGVHGQHGFDKVLDNRGDVLPCTRLVVRCALEDLLFNLFVVFSIERRGAREDHVADHSKGPDVTLLIVFSRHDFWRHIKWCADLLIELRTSIEFCSDSEVDNFGAFEVFAALEEDVLRLEVSVDDSLAVEVVEGLEHCADELAGIVQTDFVFASNSVEKFSTRHYFLNERKRGLFVVEIVELDNVWVVHLAQDVNLFIKIAHLVLAHATLL